ncbi:MAG TPA: CshA/CshB family fibrillar adhesin-related protein [Luteimonas sp.]
MNLASIPARRALVALAVASALAGAGQVQAANYASGGTGQYRNEVLWLTWGGGTNGTHDVGLANGSSTSASLQVVPGVQLAVTCALGNRSGTAIKSYRPGTWSGDALDDLYNIAGTGSANQLVTGIYTSQGVANYRVTCNATLGGVPYRIPGVVMADAESLNGNGTVASPAEFLRATAPGTWNIVEMNRVSGRNYYARKQNLGDGRQQIQFGPGGESGSSTSPAAVTFLSFGPGAHTGGNLAVSIDFAMSGGGNTAMAIGVLAPYADFGDAPASYGEVSHLVQALNPLPDALQPNNAAVNINQPSFALGGLAPPVIDYLGTRGPDVELAYQPTPNADGDDSTGSGGAAEEDAWRDDFVLYTHQAGDPVSESIACSGSGTVAGWIDFDMNGSFDADERAAAPCVGGSAQLVWDSPGALVPGRTFVRLRYALLASDVALPTGVAASGEVEDHAIAILSRADVSVDKQVSPAQALVGDTVTYTLTVANAGEGSGDASVLRDPAVPGLDCTAATLGCAAAGGAECPAAPTVAQLQSAAGVTVPVLPVGGSATFSMACTVTGP